MKYETNKSNKLKLTRRYMYMHMTNSEYFDCQARQIVTTIVTV